VRIGCVATLGHDVFIDFITSGQPLGPVRTRETSLLCQAETAIKSNPEHDFGVGVVLLSTSNLPNGHIGFYGVLAGESALHCQCTFPDGQDIIYRHVRN
jgi:hypothetical protein